MPTAFEVKRVLDHMDKIGPRYATRKELMEATAQALNLKITSPAIHYASLYASYELLCLSFKKKPMSLGRWLTRTPGRKNDLVKVY